jgi:hypothetical protein
MGDEKSQDGGHSGRPGCGEENGVGCHALESLVAALDASTNGRTLRTDIAPSGPMKGVTITPLFYEIDV